MAIGERLESYNVFDRAVIDRVVNVDEFQRSFDTHQAFFDAVEMTELRVHERTGYAPIQIVEFGPHDYDENKAIVYDLPMANPLNSNQLFQVATVAAALPERRVIAVGNPSASKGGLYDSGRLNHAQRKAVASGDLHDAVVPMLDYLEKQGVENVDHVGYSYGVDKALTAASHGTYEVGNIVAIEPVSISERRFMGRIGLGLAFGSTNKALGTYMQAPELDIFDDARHDETALSDLAYIVGLTKLSNLAIAKYLTTGKFEKLLHSTLQRQAAARAVIAWGSESELSEDEAISSLVDKYDRLSMGRVTGIRLVGAKHALANDIHLQAAIVNQALMYPEAA